MKAHTLAILLGLTGCADAPEEGAPTAVLAPGVRERLAVAFSDDELAEILTLSPLPAPPPDPTNAFADDPGAARLGQALYFDTRLSQNGEISCATCHDPEQGFSDGRALMQGLEDGVRNSPTVWNVAYNRWFFWDGRADTLWSQLLLPLESDAEMGTSRVAIVGLLRADDALRAEYQAVFGPLPAFETEPWPAHGLPAGDAEETSGWEALSERDRAGVDRVFANVGKAVAAYERLLVSRDAPFDRFVAGLESGDAARLAALSPAAQRGLQTFVGSGQCTLCHAGPNLTDAEFHNIGLSPGANVPLDIGRFEGVPFVRASAFNGLGEHSDDRSVEANVALRFVAQKPNNLGEFKTPTLRSVGDTAPYMHDGRFETLADVVRFYSELDQDPAIGHREESLVPLKLTDAEVEDLVAFLESLRGAPLPAELITSPVRD